jgi:hypothetical protein
MYKIQAARVKLSSLIPKSKFINTNQMSIHLFPAMHLYALHQYTCTRISISDISVFETVIQ